MTAKKPAITNNTPAEREYKVLRTRSTKLKAPSMATPLGTNLFARSTYIPGDGELMQSGRPGANDHLQIKSRGHAT